MTFISYAQNYEDVMLYRALKGVEKGFYIDVGAMDPILDSVTKAFYERGWRGINIEPVPQWYEKLALDRPEDTNLNVAILDRPGMVHLHEVADTGLSTFDGTLAERHRAEGGYQAQDIPVTAMTLDMVLEEHPLPEIHFLKVDVEGAERQVLEGINLERTRPWIILVEATKPLTQEQDYDVWEHLITDKGYLFVHFDGLNRFYVARERPELVPTFDAPPNVFDCFIKVSEHTVQVALSNVQATLDGVYASKS
jgi:FkbM family methyltransferase